MTTHISVHDRLPAATIIETEHANTLSHDGEATTKKFSLFVTGTDTGCGKTTITINLMRVLQGCGYRVVGMKPVATGGEWINGKCCNEDALRIQAAGSLILPYELINPYIFSPPIAPHIAAMESGQEIDFKAILTSFKAICDYADVVVVEGVGGWMVPLGVGFYVADLPRLLDIPVLLVIGLRLGCINQALLTTQSIIACKATLTGWVANTIDPNMLRSQQIVATLINLISAPYLGCMPYMAKRNSPDSSPTSLAFPSLARAEILKL